MYKVKTMFDVFGNLRRLFKRRLVIIDNTVFRLHWLLTSVILMAFSIAVATRQYVGDPIMCTKVDKMTEDVLDTYCWIHSTFTIPTAFQKKVGVEVPYPGIENTKDAEKKHYAYYQWVCFVLFLQGIMFYVPHYLWSIWEGGLLKAIVLGMQFPVMLEEERKTKKKILLEYLTRTLRHHKFYVIKYFLCELLCLINVIGQIYLMDEFFDGEFLTYGIKVVQFAQLDQEDRVDPMMFIFPRMTKCTFRKYGPSGDIEKYDTFCLLPLNILNEKIYVFLWFWFVILAGITSLVIILRVVIVAIPSVRASFLHARCRLAPREHINAIMKCSNIGDWFLLYMLGNNLDSVFFREVVNELAKKVKGRSVEGESLVI